MVRLGDKVTDNITGFCGIAIARCEYLNGCISIEVQPTKLKGGEPVGPRWIDEQRLDGKSSAKVGGPQDKPSRLSVPS